jgi:hypothetical protein
VSCCALGGMVSSNHVDKSYVKYELYNLHVVVVVAKEERSDAGTSPRLFILIGPMAMLILLFTKQILMHTHYTLNCID